MRGLDEIPDRKVAVDTPLTVRLRALRRWAAASRERRLRTAGGVLFAVALWYVVAIVTGSDGVREAVFRYELPRHRPYLYTFYLSIEDGRDPTDRMLSRLKLPGYPVEKASQCRLNRDRVPVPAHGGDSERPGAILSVESIAWLLPFLVVADGGYYGAPLAGSGHTYVLVGACGKWAVVMHKLDWMS